MPAARPTRPRRAAPGGWIALLRGLNVGGKNVLSMEALATLFEAAGAAEVRTFIQSGNVLFAASPARAPRVAAEVARRLLGTHGLSVPVVLRSTLELRTVVGANPFLKGGTDPATLHVAFLADRPSAAAAASLDPARSPPDAFALRGREVYLRLPNGTARSKLTTAWLDARLGTVSTVRNWRTVERLLALASGASPSPGA